MPNTAARSARALAHQHNPNQPINKRVANLLIADKKAILANLMITLYREIEPRDREFSFTTSFNTKRFKLLAADILRYRAQLDQLMKQHAETRKKIIPFHQRRAA